MKKKVLIVDDALFMRVMIKKAVLAAGDYEVCEASGGNEALAVYESEHPGLVLLDISMPDMNGIEVLKTIRASDKDAFIIMCSAIGQDSMIKEALENGAEDFIVKPFKDIQIQKAVWKAYGEEKEKGE